MKKAKEKKKIERGVAEKMFFETKYSGNESQNFWDVINSIKGKKRDEMFNLGVLLQNVEEYVLRKLNDTLKEKKSIKNKHKKDKIKNSSKGWTKLI